MFALGGRRIEVSRHEALQSLGGGVQLVGNHLDQIGQFSIAIARCSPVLQDRMQTAQGLRLLISTEK